MTCNACGKEHWVQVDYCYKSSVEIERDYLKSENSRLRKALKFYANCGIDHEPEKHIYNYGNTAREALKGDITTNEGES